MEYTFAYTTGALKDIKAWKKQHGTSALETIKNIQKEIIKDPTATTGLYNPEALRGNLTGWCSRRITQKDRFVYRLSPDDESVIEVSQCKGHY